MKMIDALLDKVKPRPMELPKFVIDYGDGTYAYFDKTGYREGLPEGVERFENDRCVVK